jgi:hypothetical protein
VQLATTDQVRVHHQQGSTIKQIRAISVKQECPAQPLQTLSSAKCVSFDDEIFRLKAVGIPNHTFEVLKSQ